MIHDDFHGYTFGITNGIITILSLLIGMWATNVHKVGIVGAILAMLISDPLADSYSIYNAELQKNSKNAKKAFIESFSSQALIQLIILLIVIFSPDIRTAVIISIIFGFITVIVWDIKKNKSKKEMYKNIFMMFGIILLTYTIDSQVHKYIK